MDFHRKGFIRNGEVKWGELAQDGLKGGIQTVVPRNKPKWGPRYETELYSIHL